MRHTKTVKEKELNMIKLPMNLQFFADEPAQPPTGTQPPAAQPPTGTPQQNQGAMIDYDKLIQIVNGKQSATEDTVLKGYLKQQGLSKEEMDAAINTFKQQKAANQPDVAALQSQATKAKEEAQNAAIENKAILAAIDLGIDSKTIPYVLKLADLGSVIGTDGQVNLEAVKTALDKVLEEVPQLKPPKDALGGYRQVGASGTEQQQTTEDALKAAFGIRTGN